MNEPPKRPDTATVISTLIAAAILIPLGIWLKEADPIGLRSWLHAMFSH